MRSNKDRPVNLDLMTVKVPVPAAVSFAQRVSGVLLFGMVAVLLYILDISLSNEEGFQTVKQLFNSPLVGGFVFLILLTLGYHLIAGIRHLFMDVGFFEDLKSGTISAYFVIVLFLVYAFSMFYWLFL